MSSRIPKTPIMPPASMPNQAWQRLVSSWMGQAQQGRLQNTGSLTLETDTFSTSVSDARVGIHSVIDFMPRTAAAAAEKRHMYVSGLGKNYFIVTHRYSIWPDRIFTFVILG